MSSLCDIILYIRIGKEGFIHGYRNTVSNNAIALDLSNDIVALYDNKYEGFNYKHFQEKLSEDEEITVSESFVRNLLNANGFISPKANRITKRNYLKKQIIITSKDELSEKDIDDIVELNIKDAHPSRERKKYFGELIQLDASDHLWFGDTKMHLHAAIDDATGKIIGLYFDKQETLYGYYMVYSQILHRYGIAYELLTDKRTVFEYKRKNASSIEKDTFTQFGYACKTFGTHITTSNIPQAKGRVERLFNTLLSRLISEIRVVGITTIDSANELLIPFLEKFNQKFSLQLNKT